jgi:uncharacterized damage-inducible protein DinB
MNKQELQVLYDYHYWARDRMLTAVEPLTPDQFTRDMGNSFRSVRDTVAHIYSADWAWYSRWMGESPTALIPVDMFPDVAAIRGAWTDLERNVRQLLAGLDQNGVDRRFEYRLINGQPGSGIFWQTAQHVVNHASYHRGQVTTLLRQLGAQPGKSMDLMAFYRERQS